MFQIQITVQMSLISLLAFARSAGVGGGYVAKALEKLLTQYDGWQQKIGHLPWGSVLHFVAIATEEADLRHCDENEHVGGVCDGYCCGYLPGRITTTTPETDPRLIWTSASGTTTQLILNQDGRSCTITVRGTELDSVISRGAPIAALGGHAVLYGFNDEERDGLLVATMEMAQ